MNYLSRAKLYHLPTQKQKKLHNEFSAYAKNA